MCEEKGRERVSESEREREERGRGKGTNLGREGGYESFEGGDVSGVEGEEEVLDWFVFGSVEREEDGVHELREREGEPRTTMSNSSHLFLTRSAHAFQQENARETEKHEEEREMSQRTSSPKL